MSLHTPQDISLDELKEGGSLPAEHAALDSVVWKKLDRWVLPLSTSFFVLAVVNRANIANARVAGLQPSLGMSDYQYTIALTATFVSYIAAQFPATLLLKRVGPDVMLPTMAASWGIVSATQGLVKNPSGLLACRFFLGMVEGGIFPGIVLYLSSFYPRKTLQMRVSILHGTATLCGAFSGLLAAAIDEISSKSGKPGWAWIFILEGIFTFLFGVVSFFLLPHSPEKARFLTEEEKVYVVSSLKRGGSVSEDALKDNFSWSEVINAAKSPHVWFLSITFFFSGTIRSGLAYFEPTVVVSLGYKGNSAQLMSAPPFASSFIFVLVSGVISDRYQCRGYTLIFFSLIGLIGTVMFYASTSNHVRYASLFFSMIGINCVKPPLITWISNNSAPHARRATAVAGMSSLAEVGGILATWLLGYLSSAPGYTTATITFIAMYTGMVVLSIINLVYLRRENRLKAERRQRMKKEDEPEGLGDRSAWFVYSL